MNPRTNYRAAYWTSADGQAEVVLTAPEHAGLSDEALLTEANVFTQEVGLVIGGGKITIGPWVE